MVEKAIKEAKLKKRDIYTIWEAISIVRNLARYYNLDFVVGNSGDTVRVGGTSIFLDELTAVEELKSIEQTIANEAEE